MRQTRIIVNIGRDKAARVLLAQSKLHLHVNFETEWHLKVNQALAKFVVLHVGGAFVLTSSTGWLVNRCPLRVTHKSPFVFLGTVYTQHKCSGVAFLLSLCLLKGLFHVNLLLTITLMIFRTAFHFEMLQKLRCAGLVTSVVLHK
jgi:hypothetical protein